MVFFGVCYRTALPMEGAHARTRKHTRNYLSLSHFLKWRIHARVVSRWLCLGNADPTRVLQLRQGGGGGWWKRFRFSHLFMQHFAIVAFRVLCRSLSLCFARTFSNFIAVDFIRLFLFIFTENSVWKIFLRCVRCVSATTTCFTLHLSNVL